MKKVVIGIIGLGTVGSGVFKTLKNFDNIEVKKIAVRDKTKKRNIDDFDNNLLTDNIDEVVMDSEIDIVVELIGGVEPAYSLIKKAIENGKHIVTANKELLAKHGEELFRFAEQHNKVVLYEAAIAGGIPIIMPIKTILAGNKITKIEAILNGTTNYILTKMDVEKLSYETVLKEAQELGYAETDPSGDVEGFDALYKITTLATIAFNKRIQLELVYREGISNISAQDMINANELGCKIKLVAMAKIDEEGNADVRVHPMLVSKNDTLAHINYVTNAVTLTGNPVGEITFSGPGAGEFPTASSVVGDILAIATEIDKNDYILPMMRCNHNDKAKMINIAKTKNRYYIALNAKNGIGVIKKIGEIFAEKNISLSTLIQREVRADNTADVIITTEFCYEEDIQDTILAFEADNCINKVDSLIRFAR